MHFRKIFYVIIFSWGCFSFVIAQKTDSYVQLDSMLKARVKDIPALDQKVSISVSGVSVEEFLRGVANSTGLNLDVQSGIDNKVINNFTDVKARDILVYLCRQFNLELKIVGNIISIVKKPDYNMMDQGSVKWDKENKLITLDFNNTAIEQAAREITQKTKANVILAPGVDGKSLNGYIESKPLKSALEKLAFSNGLEMKQTEDNYFILEPASQPPEPEKQSTGDNSFRDRNNNTRDFSNVNGKYQLHIDYYSADSINIFAENAPIDEVLRELSQKAGFSYFLSPKIHNPVNVQIQGFTVDKIMEYLFDGTDAGFRKSDGVYLIGGRDIFDYDEHKIVRLQNRSIDGLLKLIPDDISKNLILKEFPELNGIFVSGPAFQVDEFEKFIHTIDQPVPVVLIEVIILYVNKTVSVSTGIEAGLGDKPVASSGTVFPSVDLHVGADQINRVLNGLGWVNLGKVTPNFYLNLQAMESQGLLTQQSTPKLSTLNGHEATMSIGNTEYYLEEQTSLFGTQNPEQTTTQTYKAVNAELSLKIKPVVSADGEITMDVEVKQSDFTDRISKTAPPGTVNRDFTSMIRVKDQEMVLLGGLMEKKNSDAGTGTPILSRIPIIKWFFSSRKLENSDSKLSVLIKPTIID